MKFGQEVDVIKTIGDGINTVKGVIVGMKGNKVKIKQKTYYGIEQLDFECFGGVWVNKSQIIEGVK